MKQEENDKKVDINEVAIYIVLYTSFTNTILFCSLHWQYALQTSYEPLLSLLGFCVQLSAFSIQS